MKFRKWHFLCSVAKQHGYERQRGEWELRVATQAAFYDFCGLRRPCFGYVEGAHFGVYGKPEFLSLFIGSHVEMDELRRLPFQIHKVAYRHVAPFVFQPAPEVLVPGYATLYAWHGYLFVLWLSQTYVPLGEHFNNAFVIFRVQT